MQPIAAPWCWAAHYRDHHSCLERKRGAPARALAFDKSLHSTSHLEPAPRNTALCKLQLERLWAGTTTGEKKMNYQQDAYQQSSWQNPMQWSGNSHTSAMNLGLGQAAYGLQSGPQGTGQFGGGWGQRQLSPLDVSEVVRQMVPLLPQILAQAQQPMAAFGYGASQRQLSPQDINEVVRQLLPILPQIIGAIQQGQSPMHAAAIYGGFGQQGFGQPQGFGQSWQNPFAQQPQMGLGFGNPHGQFGSQGQFGQSGSPFQAAFGGFQSQRQLSPQDVNEV